MAAADKDTIYIDIDDEITGIIDKLSGSPSKVVALVLPKRATAFQSIVNMKLLKRAADQAQKNLVLITTEAGLLPLAGAAGVHVAPSLTSKPSVPKPPDADDGHEEEVEETAGDTEVTADTDGDKPIGDLAGMAGAAAAGEEVETLELDNAEDETDAEGGTDIGKPKSRDFTPPPDKIKKDHKLHVPNFERFRVLLAVGALVLILLIIGIIVAMKVLPKAEIDIKTDASNVNVNLSLNLSTTAKTLDPTSSTLPAKQQTQSKTYTQQVTATGTKNLGNKATGTVTIVNCDSSDVTIPAGSGLTSGGNTYITQKSVTVPDSNFTSPGSGSVCKNDGKANVDITAQSGGTSSNVPAGSKFTLNSSSHYNASSLSATGSASGGTDNNVQVVSQADIDNAKGKINTNDPSVKQALETGLEQGNYFAITETFSAGTPTINTSAKVGDEASSVTVTEVVNYTMFGVQRDDLNTLIKNNVKDQIDTSQQSILSTGVDHAIFNVNSATDTGAQLAMSTTAEVGPQLDTEAIKSNSAGEKAGTIKSQISSNPDVTEVKVKLSPFWVTVVPKNTSKITVNVAKPTQTVNSNSH
ncbi:MAG TPA: hypothetical protein VHB51_02000 [Candidatus Saccharimonadales bacterium]|nr:hypothetical protein [Candidatus Saccharimonadales bacterium]